MRSVPLRYHNAINELTCFAAFVTLYSISVPDVPSVALISQQVSSASSRRNPKASSLARGPLAVADLRHPKRLVQRPIRRPKLHRRHRLQRHNN